MHFFHNFQCSHTIILSHPKDSLPGDLTSCVVYLIPCRDCSDVYIGETGLHLSTRIKQHKDSVRKGEIEKSAVAEHVWNIHHTNNWDNVTIIDKDKYAVSREIRDAIYIRRNTELMNRDRGIDISPMWDSLHVP